MPCCFCRGCRLDSFIAHNKGKGQAFHKQDYICSLHKVVCLATSKVVGRCLFLGAKERRTSEKTRKRSRRTDHNRTHFYYAKHRHRDHEVNQILQSIHGYLSRFVVHLAQGFGGKGADVGRGQLAAVGGVCLLKAVKVREERAHKTTEPETRSPVVHRKSLLLAKLNDLGCIQLTTTSPQE